MGRAGRDPTLVRVLEVDAAPLVDRRQRDDASRSVGERYREFEIRISPTCT